MPGPWQLTCFHAQAVYCVDTWRVVGCGDNFHPGPSSARQKMTEAMSPLASGELGTSDAPAEPRDSPHVLRWRLFLAFRVEE